MILRTVTMKRVLLFCAFLFSLCALEAQQTPFNPVSHRIFTPFIINPAITGTKDFTTIDLAASVQGDNMSQILSGNGRLSKMIPGYFSSPGVRDFTNIGVGGSLFNDKFGTSHSIGLIASVSYQVPLDARNMSFVSFGASVKGIYNMMDSIADLGAPAKNTFIPNLDLGVYFYSQKFYAGISSTNILGNMLDSTDMSIYMMPVSRQYFFMAGYKFVLSKPLNIVLEPSLLINLGDTISDDYSELLQPGLKLYFDNLCFGSFIHNYDYLSFFFQYKFPKFYIGAFFDFPRETAFYKKELGIELTLGINFSSLKPVFLENWHW